MRGLPRSSRVELSLIAAVLAVAALKTASPLLVPVATAIFVAIVNFPAVRWLRRRGVPAVLAIAMPLLMDIVVIASLVGTLVAATAELRMALPAYTERFYALSAQGAEFLRSHGAEVPSGPLIPQVGIERLLSVATFAFGAIAKFFALCLLVLLLTALVLAETAWFPEKVREAVGRRNLDLSRYSRIVLDVQRYLAVKAAVSLATGILIGLGMHWLQVDFALLWGVVAFLLNFIPNIGSVVASIPGILIALLQHGPTTALGAAFLYLGVNVCLGNILEPTLVGRQIGLSVLGVIFSLLFWGWVWGVPGMFLAVPLTLVLKIALEDTRSYRWIAVLLSPRRGRRLERDKEATLPAATVER